MSDAYKRIYLFHTAFRACSTPFKEYRVGFVEEGYFTKISPVFSYDTKGRFGLPEISVEKTDSFKISFVLRQQSIQFHIKFF